MMNKLVSVGMVMIAAHTCFAGKSDTERYTADVTSLKDYQVPEWYQDAKFGIWPHWGIYSVPAYRGNHDAAWYGRWMNCVQKGTIPDDMRWNDYWDRLSVKTAAHHREKYGDPSEFGYHDFAPMWKAEQWDPDDWAQMAVDAGAKFFCMMGVHHDSFALYDSDLTRWDSVDMGPKRDLCAEMEKAVRAKGLKFGVSNHLAWNHAFHKFYFNNGFDKGREDLADFYSKGVVDEEYMRLWWAKTKELADKLKPDLYYFDWGWHDKAWVDGKYHEKFASFFYNRGIEWGRGTHGDPGVVLNSKFGPMSSYCVRDLERATMTAAQPRVWQTDTSISPTCWGYAAEDDSFFSTEHLIATLVDIVSKNGVLLLNFGPKPDGTVPQGYYDRLMGMGEWLKVNGEAIYATRPWKVAEEGPTSAGGHHSGEEKFTAKDIRYTRSKDGSKLYATMLGFPKDEQLTLLATKVVSVPQDAKVTMLANGMNIPFSLNAQKQLVLDTSAITRENAGCEHAYSFRIENMKVDNANLDPIDFAEVYIHDVKDHDPLAEKFDAEFPYLSAVTPIYDKVHGGVKRDVNYFGRGKISIGGKTYEHGLMLCPSGGGNKGLFFIKTEKLPKISGLTAEIGIDDAMKNSGNSAFIVDAYVAGQWQQLYKSPVLTYDDKAVKIDVKIPSNATYVRLITTDGGNGCGADHAVWGDAKFVE